MSASAKPIRVAVIGMGGFAAAHHYAIYDLEERGDCSLVCTCDPTPTAFTQLREALSFDQRGVVVFEDYKYMLEQQGRDLDVVTIPTPVPLHAEMHATCIDRGIAVYLEKPPTLDHFELDTMLQKECSAAKLTNVGFNYITEEPRQILKSRLIKGDFGGVREVGFWGLWPRASSYFRRSSWAGRLMLNGRLVLDSCMGNAMAHYVHDVLFWAGTGKPQSWGDVDMATAELYRAHSIQSMDTVFVEGLTSAGVKIRLAISHACAGRARECEWIRCDAATIHYGCDSGYRIDYQDGRTETGPVPGYDGALARNLRNYFDYVRGRIERPATRLIDSKPFVDLCGLVFIAASDIHVVPESFIARIPGAQAGDEFIAIDGIEDAVCHFVAEGRFPSEQHCAWGAPGGTATIDQLHTLPEVIRALAS